MTPLPLYTIQPDGDAFQVCLVFHDDTLPIPGKRYTSHEVARLVVAKMEQEDTELWLRSRGAPPSREYDAHGDPYPEPETCIGCGQTRELCKCAAFDSERK